ncbi:DUF1697 domain-containing protein [Colwellia sp. D2M02]|uniref:DUF1697 domain-containing protein n=1 Tax=Colwellia sp. D2M02 TaxID=2841562 RepID=UPI001C09E5F6|nr:DUF1697 domain-containing protein [Colwellia sp. D2M02]MBU2893371.1 DUF1697 domain-containing protein [Colwellia sp. D2M02]
MHSYVILFRGINVSGKNILPMKNLAELLTQHGFKQVKTYIQSGNVIALSELTASEVSEQITALVAEHFGFTAPVMVFTKAQFNQFSMQNPYGDVEGKFCHLYFCNTQAQLNQEKLAQYNAASEQYQLHDNVFYLHAPDGIGRSKLVANIELCLGVTATGRNLNTVNKLNSLLESISA